MSPVERTDEESPGSAGSGEITTLLRQWKHGVAGAEEKLYDLVFPHLRKLARNWLKKERRGHPMDSVGLVAEEYLRLLPAKDRVDWRNRDHFYAISARVMRRYLIDIGRKRSRTGSFAAKRRHPCRLAGPGQGDRRGPVLGRP